MRAEEVAAGWKTERISFLLLLLLLRDPPPKDSNTPEPAGRRIHVRTEHAHQKGALVVAALRKHYEIERHVWHSVNKGVEWQIKSKYKIQNTKFFPSDCYFRLFDSLTAI